MLNDLVEHIKSADGEDKLLAAQSTMVRMRCRYCPEEMWTVAVGSAAS